MSATAHVLVLPLAPSHIIRSPTFRPVDSPPFFVHIPAPAPANSCPWPPLGQKLHFWHIWGGSYTALGDIWPVNSQVSWENSRQQSWGRLAPQTPGALGTERAGGGPERGPPKHDAQGTGCSCPCTSSLPPWTHSSLPFKSHFLQSSWLSCSLPMYQTELFVYLPK